MAVNYTDLFENLGEFVEAINAFQTIYTTLDGARDEILAELYGNSDEDLLEGIHPLFDDMKGDVLSWIGEMKGYMQDVLTAREDILKELVLDTASVPTVLDFLIRDMYENSQTVKASSVTIGAVTEVKTHTNAGSVILGKVLDGYSSPHPGYVSNRYYKGVDSELAAPSESMRIECTYDSVIKGSSEGGEYFSWSGTPNPGDRYHWDSYGVGSGIGIQTANSFAILSNLGFENFTLDAPDDWDIDSGAAGAHIHEETTSVYRGDSALKMLGDGTSDIQISQSVPAGSVDPNRRYCVTAWVKGEAGILNGTLEISFEGTGYTPLATEKIQMNAATLAGQTSYDYEYFCLNMPEQIPSDFKLVVKVTGGLTSGKSVLIDDITFSPVYWLNGVHATVIAGQDPFVLGDRFLFDVTNDEAGVFQTAFGRLWGVQLPSDSSGGETISDSLASD